MDERDEQTQAMLQQAVRDLWLWWVVATAVGELVGFAVPAIIGPAAAWAMRGMVGTSAAITVVGVAVLAGSGEGAILGFAQGLILRRYIQNMAQWKWVLATAVAAALAWAIGMLPSTLQDVANIDITKVNLIIFISAAVLLGIVFLLSIGFAQWLVLRRHVGKAGWWILANAIAWPVGVTVPAIGLSLVPDGSPMVVWIIVGIVSGALMGIVVGAITGTWLVWLLRTHLSSSK